MSVDIETIVRSAMRRAYNYGQTYWQQADSESFSQQKKSDITAESFQLFIEETCALLAAHPVQPKPVAEIAEINGCKTVFFDKNLPVGTKLYCSSAHSDTQVARVPSKGDYIMSMLGAKISVDVSTCDGDAGNRIFATVEEFQEDGEDSIIFLAVEQSRNFVAQPTAAIDEKKE